jgi:hypothetical protein
MGQKQSQRRDGLSIVAVKKDNPINQSAYAKKVMDGLPNMEKLILLSGPYYPPQQCV